MVRSVNVAGESAPEAKRWTISRAPAGAPVRVGGPKSFGAMQRRGRAANGAKLMGSGAVASAVSWRSAFIPSCSRKTCASRRLAGVWRAAATMTVSARPEMRFLGMATIRGCYLDFPTRRKASARLDDALNPETHASAAAVPVFGEGVPPVYLCDPLDQGEAETERRAGPAPGRLTLIEALEGAR